jgi:hypothetical protein
MLFQGTAPPRCGQLRDDSVSPSSGLVPVAELYGFAASDETWTRTVVSLPVFLSRTCLSYCEFLELWKSRFVPFGNGSVETPFPDCEPCCPETCRLVFPERPGVELGLTELSVFIRLWRKLKDSCCGGYSFAHLCDICTVLQLFQGTSINPDFIRQLVAFQMLRDQFHLPLVDPRDHSSSATGPSARTSWRSGSARPRRSGTGP